MRGLLRDGNSIHSTADDIPLASACDVADRRMTASFRNRARPLVWATAAASLFICSKGFGEDRSSIDLTIDAGTPLRVALSSRTSIDSVGAPVRAVLVRPIYVGSYRAIPAGARVTGKILTLEPVNRSTRIRAISGGDFTPLHKVRLEFDQLVLPDGERIAIHSAAVGRNARLVKLNSRQRTQSQSFLSKAHEELAGLTEDQRKMLAQIRGPGRLEFAEDWLYSNLPYHPQSLPRGAQFDVELKSPVALNIPLQEAEVQPVQTRTPVLRARMLSTITSESAHEGMPVEAILTEPVQDDRLGLSLPEGTRLSGVVTYARPARSFGRTGELRFTIGRLTLPQNEVRNVNGILQAAEVDPKANAAIDTEGGTHAHSKNRWIGPMTYAMFAGALYFGFSQRHDDNAVIRAVLSNGFGSTGNFLGSISGPAATGVSYYGLARSVVLNVFCPGQNIVFPKDTLLEIRLADDRPDLRAD
jgi:hypothetical protein